MKGLHALQRTTNNSFHICWSYKNILPCESLGVKTRRVSYSIHTSKLSTKHFIKMATEPLFPTEVAGYLGDIFKKLGNVDGLKND